MRRLAKNCLMIVLFSVCSQTLLAYHKGQIKRSQSFSSKILKQDAHYSIYLPPSYHNNDSINYDLMYLLHGFGGDENSWISRCDIANLIDSLISTNSMPELIIIMPEAKNSYYINDFQSNYNFEDYFIEELIPHINSNFRVDTSSRPILCGLSMGGFGAVILPVKHPDKFASSISLSAAVRTPKMFKSLSQTGYNKYFGSVFGHNLEGEERITDHWKKNSPYFLIDSTNFSKLKDISWYIDCGMNDFLFLANKAFHQLLLRYEIPHEYHMRIGNHSWEYWRDGFINSMISLKK